MRQRSQNRPVTATFTEGFTLVELVVVMTLAVVMTAIAIPSLIRTTSSRASAAARMLTKDINFARSWSISTGRKSWIVLSTSPSNYTLVGEPPGTVGRVSAVAIADPVTGQDVARTLNTGDFAAIQITAVTVPGGGNEVGFDWQGRPFGAAGTILPSDASITLSGGRSVTIGASTGLARWQ